MMMVTALLNITILFMFLVRGVHCGWSAWGSWSDCSRTCGGGASYSIRSCYGGRCSGENIKYRSCNIEACPRAKGSSDYRAQQCSKFNDDKNVNGKSYDWIPKIQSDREKSCALICRAKGHDEKVEELAPKVLDGTPCFPDKKDMCINGICVPVGCDYELYSTAVEDECGVCNGDGSTCKVMKGNHRLSPDISRGIEEVVVIPNGSLSVRVTFRGKAHLGVRDKTTRRGLNQNAGYSIPEGSYDIEGNTIEFSQTRSGREVIQIAGPTTANLSVTVLYIEASNTHGKVHYQFVEPLQHLWKHVGWTECSLACGGGFQGPVVMCIDITTGLEVDASQCEPKQKPVIESKKCNEKQCPPKWQPAPWSACSKTCGGGMQTREVTCAERSNSVMVRMPDLHCPGTKPATKRVCNMDQCPMWYPEKWSECTATCGSGTKTRKVHCRDIQRNVVNGCDPDAKPVEEKECVSKVVCIKEKVFEAEKSVQEFHAESFEPRFFIGEWSPCSASCNGTQTRSVICQVPIEFTDIVADVPDDQCKGEKPVEHQMCNIDTCSNDGEADDLPGNSESGTVYPIPPSNSVEEWVPSFEWRYNGYTDCSASCLGGVQTSITECYHASEDRVVDDSFCELSETLPLVQQSCNNFPCPPRWSIRGYSPCSVGCGGGIQHPLVECIEELAAGSGNTIILREEWCTGPKPNITKPCNFVDCPPAWKTTEWSQCSQSCSGGIQTRTVTCSQMLAFGNYLELPEPFCMEPRPAEEKICNEQDCVNAVWVSQPWSECSVTCGAGLQIRAVICMTQLPSGEQQFTFPSDCDSLPEPPLLQPCVGPPCPVIEEYPSPKKEPLIMGDASHFVQEKFSTKLIFAVGGSASVFPHVLILLKCPVRWFKKSQIRWHRNDQDIGENDVKAKVLKDGRLKIYSVGPEDVGSYTCVAGTASEDFELSIQDKSLSATVAESNSLGWAVGKWSECSESCGDGGIQIRKVHCEALMSDTNTTKEVQEEFCQFIEMPMVMQPCFQQPCPLWNTGDWSPCNTRCVEQFTAIQRRSVHCTLPDGSRVPKKHCNKREKPVARQECHTDNCEAVWRPSKWMKCSQSCGDSGTQTRTLGCVYKGRKQPADVKYCREKEKPELVRACNRIECSANSCVDAWTYCTMAKRLNMCQLKNYQEQCCLSCRQKDQR
ncbi:ADAMTS-like protein 1 isoform X2 [Ptychodera flava]|uniref:ADAMTS-like protein 1 isoform X2 n=1 Tax=Ptychodera flava TaxID=63121 RepID=UPI00396AA3C9